jgi:hypothetical protein
MLPLILGAIGPILERVFPDPIEREKVALQVAEAAQRGDLAQIDVNKNEALSQSVFVAGWRPFVGWVCGLALAWDALVRDIAISVAGLFNERAATFLLNMPRPDSDTMWVVLTGMLGIGAMRSFDKRKK